MSKEKVKEQLDFIKKYYEDFEIAVTTSPRTSKIIEDLVQSYNFDYEVIFSQNRVNPIPDFLEQCNTVFITGDSTSMISEAITYGRANVIVLPLESRGENKFIRFVKTLEKDGYLHLFNGTLENKNRKIDFKMYLQRVKS
jgi:mitochondrial fission protein ELM1